MTYTSGERAESGRQARAGQAGVWMLSVLIAWASLGCVGEMAQPPEPTSCTAKSSRTCFCADGEAGVQSCTTSGDMWSECRCSCTPGEFEECACEDGTIGIRDCHSSGEFWTPCQCLSEEERLRREMELIEQDPRCGVGENYCDGVGCVNLAASDANCGGCGIACEGCDRCFRGVCTTVCCSNETNCGSLRNPLCSDLDSDPENCGVCGASCAGNEACVQGACVPN